MNSPFHENHYEPIEEKPVRWITRRIGEYLGSDKGYPIEIVSLGGLFCQLLACLDIFNAYWFAAAILILFSFFLDKLDGDIARAKAANGYKVHLGAGTFLDGFLDILGITAITSTVVIIAGYDRLLSCMALVGPLLFWYVNAGIAAYLPKPEAKIGVSPGWKQFISYSKSKEVIMQVVTIATGQFWIYLILHALIVPYSVVIFLKKFWREYYE